MSNTEVVKHEPKAALVTGGQVAPIVPRTIEESYRLADAIFKSGLAPKGLDSPEKCMVAIIAGSELGMPPFQSVQSYMVTGGRPTLWGDGLLGVVRAHGFRVREWTVNESPDFPDDMTAHCEVIRPDTGEVVERKFSVADAKRAKLWNKKGYNGQDTPWVTTPQRMLQMRARGWACRDGVADVLKGFQMREEVEDYDAPPEAASPATSGISQRLKQGQPEGFSAARAAETAEVVDAEVEELREEAERERLADAEEPKPQGSNEGVITDRRPAKDEPYFWAGDTELTPTGRRALYKNGEKFSTVTPRGTTPIYAEHYGEAEDEPEIRANPEERRDPVTGDLQDETGAVVEPQAPMDADFEDLEPAEPTELDDISKFLAELSSLNSWADIKPRFVRELMPTQTWQEAENSERKRVRQAVWARVWELGQSGEDKSDPGSDPSLFRIWLDAADDADVIRGTFEHALKKSEIWSRLNEAQQATLQQAVNEAIAGLGQ